MCENALRISCLYKKQSSEINTLGVRKTTVIFNSFDQIKVSIEHYHVCMEGHLTLRLRSFSNNRDDISCDHFGIVFVFFS